MSAVLAMAAGCLTGQAIVYGFAAGNYKGAFILVLISLVLTVASATSYIAKEKK